MLIFIESHRGKLIGTKNISTKLTNKIREEIKEEVYAKHNGMKTTGFVITCVLANGTKRKEILK